MARHNDMSEWVGWIAFASFMLLLGGFFSGIAGIAALFKDTIVYNSATTTTWVLDYTQWGWIHIIFGLLAIGAAGSLMAGRMYGRIFAVVVALLSAVANLAFVPMHPIWSTIVIVVDVLVIFAVTVHGKEIKGLINE